MVDYHILNLCLKATETTFAIYVTDKLVYGMFKQFLQNNEIKARQLLSQRENSNTLKIRKQSINTTQCS